ncbi:MAG: hypothetical protein ACI8TQ_003517 [Planctomycetota bacterium]|jgi:hypothetical protein
MTPHIQTTPARLLRVALLTATMSLVSCVSFDDGGPSLEWWNENPPIPTVDVSSSADGIVALPASAHQALRRVFDKYTHLVAPSGRPIHFLAQPGVANECLIRAREMMRFFLTDANGTLYGSDKSEVANQMADRWATLVIFESYEDSLRAQKGELPSIPMFFQDLYADECVLEGSTAYMENSVRDATMEAVFSLVHGAGIRFAQPSFEQQIKTSAHGAVLDGNWNTNLDWVLEASSGHRYISNVLEVYYGIWAHDPHSSGRAFGDEYAFINRTAMKAGDPLGLGLLEVFFPETLGYQSRIVPTFDGVFSLVTSPDLPYTLKSRYLTNVSLTGALSSSLRGNAFDNYLRGNAGDNGIDGGAGIDTVLFKGPRDEYTIEITESGVSVLDSVANRDGHDVLTEVECLHFFDGPMAIVGECAHDLQWALPETASRIDATRSWGRYEHNLGDHMESVLTELLECFDRNRDGELGVDETALNFRKLVKLADRDEQNGSASRYELLGALELVFTGQVELTLNPNLEVERFFEQFDQNGDGKVTPNELPAAMRAGFDRADKNGDGGISPAELLPSYQG